MPLQNRVKALESEVKAYVDLHRAELDGKSRALNFGTVGYRVSSKLMLASSRVAEAIATLKVLGHTELIKTTETLDREALKRQPGDILQQVGAYIRTVDEFYYECEQQGGRRVMTSIAGGLNTGIWLCAVVLGATGSAIIVTVAASLLCAGVKCIVKHFKNGG